MIIVQAGEGEFFVMGRGVTLTFSLEEGRGKVGIEEVQEGDFDESGRWKVKRWLNGDQTHQGRHVRLPGEEWSVQLVKLYRY